MRNLALLVVVVLAALVGPRSAPALAEAPEPPEITARGAVVWDPADAQALFDRDAEVGRPMASITKIMTVLLAIEAGMVGDTVTVSPAAAALGQATLNLRAGQEIPMESLIAGLLLRSGNDAALAVAEHVAGSEAAFVGRMNARADELGLAETHFVNASGLTNDPAHRASPVDLARLADVAMGHEVFARYAGAATANVPGLPPMTSRNELLGSYPGATGVKTGFTTAAGLSLVASAARDGHELYAVVLGSAGVVGGTRHFAEAAALLDYGFDAYRRVEPVPPDGRVTTYRWADTEVGLVLDGALARTVETGAQVVWRTHLHPIAERPLAAGTRLGSAQLVAEDDVVAEAPLVAVEEVPDRAPAVPAASVGGAVQEALRAFARLAEIDRAS